MWPLAIAFIPPLLWAITNILDDKLLHGKIKDPLALVVITGIFSLLPLGYAAWQGGLIWPGAQIFLLASAAGVVGLAVYYPYYKALEIEPPATVLLMWNLSPVLIAVLACILLQEKLRMEDYVAIGLLVASSLIAEYSASKQKKRGRQAFLWICLASALIATEALLEKELFDRVHFLTGLGWISLAIFATAVMLVGARGKTRHVLNTVLHHWRVERFCVINELLDIGAVVALSFAVSQNSVSLVHGIGGLQPVFVLLLTPLFGRFKKHSRAENIKTVIAIVCALAGLVLLKTFD